MMEESIELKLQCMDSDWRFKPTDRPGYYTFWSGETIHYSDLYWDEYAGNLVMNL